MNEIPIMLMASGAAGESLVYTVIDLPIVPTDPDPWPLAVMGFSL